MELLPPLFVQVAITFVLLINAMAFLRVKSMPNLAQVQVSKDVALRDSRGWTEISH